MQYFERYRSVRKNALISIAISPIVDFNSILDFLFCGVLIPDNNLNDSIPRVNQSNQESIAQCQINPFIFLLAYFVQTKYIKY
jgi:hypothetical protein